MNETFYIMKYRSYLGVVFFQDPQWMIIGNW